MPLEIQSGTVCLIQAVYFGIPPARVDRRSSAYRRADPPRRLLVVAASHSHLAGTPLPKHRSSRLCGESS